MKMCSWGNRCSFRDFQHWKTMWHILQKRKKNWATMAAVNFHSALQHGWETPEGPESAKSELLVSLLHWQRQLNVSEWTWFYLISCFFVTSISFLKPFYNSISEFSIKFFKATRFCKTATIVATSDWLSWDYGIMVNFVVFLYCTVAQIQKSIQVSKMFCSTWMSF